MIDVMLRISMNAPVSGWNVVTASGVPNVGFKKGVRKAASRPFGILGGLENVDSRVV